MDTDVYYKLEEIKNKWGKQKLGQICQNLLTLALSNIFNPEKIEIKNIEGVDIEIDEDYAKYAIEVKTTSGNSVIFGKKDYKGLQKFALKGYKIILAVLKIDMFSSWIFADASKIKSGNLKISDLYTPDNLKEFSSSVHQEFEKVVLKEGGKVIEKGEGYTIDILKQKGIKYSGER